MPPFAGQTPIAIPTSYTPSTNSAPLSASDAAYLQSKVTVILTTSPIQSHPSTTIFEQVLSSLSLVPGLATCDLIVTFDGWRPGADDKPKSGRVSAETGKNYAEYTQKVTDILFNRLPAANPPPSDDPFSLLPSQTLIDGRPVTLGRIDTTGLWESDKADSPSAIPGDRLICMLDKSPSNLPRMHANYLVTTDTDRLRTGPQTSCLAHVVAAHKIVSSSEVSACPSAPTSSASLCYKTPLRTITFTDRMGFALCVRTALSYVRTPYVMVVQHDWQFVEPLDLVTILRTMELRDDEVKYVGFVSSGVLNYAEKKGTGRGLPPSKVQDGHFAIPLVRLFFWFDKNHIASTHHYRSFVYSQNRFQRGDFIEDTFGQVQLNDCKRATPEEGIEVHKQYATWLYYPNDGGTRHLFHLHGRKFLTENGKKRFEERQREMDLGWKIRRE
ncbi:hypothetical protein HK097_001017, partial [Rhizophlyctis rosea]